MVVINVVSILYVGVKMIVSPFYPISTLFSLYVVGGVLALSVAASVARNRLNR